jgi:peptidoglycan hydrolase CwlO-like protein
MDANVINGVIGNAILVFSTIIIPGSIFFFNISKKIDNVGINVGFVKDDIEKMSKQIEKIENKIENNEQAVNKLHTTVGVLQAKVEMLEKNNEKHIH